MQLEYAKKSRNHADCHPQANVNIFGRLKPVRAFWFAEDVLCVYWWQLLYSNQETTCWVLLRNNWTKPWTWAVSKPSCALHFGAGDGNTGDGHGPAAARSCSAGFALLGVGRMPTCEWASVDARDVQEIYVGSSFSVDFCCQVGYLSGLCHTSHPKASTARGQGHAIKMTMDDRWQGMMKENANGFFMAITQSHPRFIRIKISPGGAGAFCQGVRPLRTKRHGAYGSWPLKIRINTM